MNDGVSGQLYAPTLPTPLEMGATERHHLQLTREIEHLYPFTKGYKPSSQYKQKGKNRPHRAVVGIQNRAWAWQILAHPELPQVVTFLVCTNPDQQRRTMQKLHWMGASTALNQP